MTLPEDQDAPRSSLFNAESEKLPAGVLVSVFRWWLPIALCVLGLAILVVDGFDTTGIDAFAVFAGAGSSIWLINFLWRLGVTGDEERDLEAKDRVYLREHGHWPDEQ